MGTEILIEGLNLMLVGISAVTIFLSILVAATKLMSQMVIRFQVIEEDQDADEMAAVAAAVSYYRRDHPGSRRD